MATPPVPARGPHVGWAVGGWLVAAACLLGALVTGAIAGYGFWLHHRLEDVGVTVPAKVFYVDGRDVTVEFTTESGALVTDAILWTADPPAEGDEVQVTYDPDDIESAVRAGATDDRDLAVKLAVVSGVLVLLATGATIGAVVVHRRRSRARRSA